MRGLSSAAGAALAIAAQLPACFALRPLEDYQEAHGASADTGAASELLEATAANHSLSQYNPEECLFLIHFMYTRITGAKPRAKKTENAQWLAFYYRKMQRVSNAGDILSRKTWTWPLRLQEAYTLLGELASMLNVVNTPKRYQFRLPEYIEADTTRIVNSVLSKYFDTRVEDRGVLSKYYDTQERGLLTNKITEIKEGALNWNNKCYAKKSTGKMFDDWYRQQGKEPPHEGLVAQSPHMLTRGLLSVFEGFNRANWDAIIESCVAKEKRDFTPIDLLQHAFVELEPKSQDVEDREFKV
mmetsp:Transcript_22706/g.51879  ORF Transcript_22706/g.51879 Transcript_22706/m.51879 type:complete len:299 (+) Transcript_22706:53-949(+)